MSTLLKRLLLSGALVLGLGAMTPVFAQEAEPEGTEQVEPAPEEGATEEGTTEEAAPEEGQTEEGAEAPEETPEEPQE